MPWTQYSLHRLVRADWTLEFIRDWTTVSTKCFVTKAWQWALKKENVLEC